MRPAPIGEESWLDRNRLCEREAPRTRPDPDLACVECLEDGVTVDCHGRCRECRQTDTETDAEWEARIALRGERA